MDDMNLAAKPVLAQRREALLQKTVALTTELATKAGRKPHLSVILVGEDPASKIYVQKKGEAAEAVGFTHETILFSRDTSPQVVLEKVRALNQNSRVDGILIQRPLPSQFKEKDAVLWVDPKKDVDCLHPENVGLLVGGTPRFLPCTPAGVLLILDYYQIPIEKKLVAVIGRSAIVGKPLAALVLSRNGTLIQMHRSTPNPQALCRQCDIVLVAAGSPHLVNKDWIKPGATVIDVGIHRDSNGKIIGDVDADSVRSVAGALSPVPGGVGPMTIQVLLENTFESFKTNFVE